MACSVGRILAVEAYVDKFNLYSTPDQDTYMDRVYRNSLTAPLGGQILVRVGDVLEPESGKVQDEVKQVVE
ncbi:MAG: hypothetical protein ABEJ87_05435, partial [Candidatus Nanohalobium sp.]